MKKKLKKLFYLSLFLSGLIIAGCELQEGIIEQHNHKQNLKMYEKTFDELMADKRFTTSFNKMSKSKKNIATSMIGRTIMENQYGFTIATKPAYVLEDGETTSYTFLITRDTLYDNSFENLVVQTDSLQNTTAVIIKYNITSEVKGSNHNSYSFESTKEITPIVYNNQNISNKMVYSCVNVNIYICCKPFNSGDTGCHIAQPICYTDGNVTPYTTTECTEYDDGTIDTGGGGSGPNDGSSGSNPIKTNPVMPEIQGEKDPCTEAKPAIDKAKSLFQNNNVLNGMDTVLKAKVNEEGQKPYDQQKEWGVAIGQTGTTLNVTAPKLGNATQGSIPTSQVIGNYVADGHSHPTWGDACASGGDFYEMLNIVINNTAYHSRFIYGIGKDINNNSITDVYALVVTDKNAAINFLNQYPQIQNLNPMTGSFYKDTQLGVDFYQIRDKFMYGSNINEGQYSSGAVALSYILNKYKTGISVAKVDSNGNLKALNVTKESTGTTPNEFKISAKKCP